MLGCEGAVAMPRCKSMGRWWYSLSSCTLYLQFHGGRIRSDFVGLFMVEPILLVLLASSMCLNFPLYLLLVLVGMMFEGRVMGYK